MINNTSDKNILKLIKYAPVTVTLCFSAVMIFLLVQENQLTLERDIKALSQDSISQQRMLLKNQIDALSTQVSYEKNNATEQLQNDIKEQVLEAHEMASGIYRSNVNLSKKEISNRIKEALRNIRFHSGRGYFFAMTAEGISELSPINPTVEGKSVRNLKDFNGALIIEDMIALMKGKDQTFYHYYFSKPGKFERSYFKVSFIKRFEPLQWYIGTGEYLIDFETDLQEELLSRLQLNRENQSYDYYIVDDALHYISHGDKGAIGELANSTVLDLKHIAQTASYGQFIDSSSNFTDENGLLKGSITYARYNTDWKWTIAGSIDLTQVNKYFLDRKLKLEARNKETLCTLLILSIALSLFLALTSVVISRNTAKRFKRYESKVLRNLTKLKQSKEQLRFLANHDPLTKLPNRRALEASIERDIALCAVHNKHMAVLFFDLDDFKKINDHYGHSTGDELLAVLGQKFKEQLRPQDKVFRFGGDEFIFCFPMLCDLDDAKDKVLGVQEVMQQKIELTNHSLHIKGSIGIAMYPNDGAQASELIRKADLVLYKSKAQEKGSFLFYEQALHTELERALVIESELRIALDNNELSLVYQPQICATSKQIMGVEALVRWHSDKLGFVAPDEFIAIAENVGLIDKVGQFVIEQSCQDIAEFNRHNLSPVTLSINVSPAQLIKDNFVDNVCEITKRYGISNAYITIEITENVLISDVETSKAIIESLRQHGFDVSLDDFGTGYSSLSYLSQLPINEIKIDRSFILEFLSSEQSLSLVKSIILIAESCHMSVVAEGVETNEQYQTLKRLGCDIIQGYFFSKPIDIDELYSHYPPELDHCTLTHEYISS